MNANLLVLKEAMIFAVMNAIYTIAYRSVKKSGLQPRWGPDFFRLLNAIA